MKVQAAFLGQDPVHFNQPDSQPAKERSHSIRMISPPVLNGLPDTGPVILDSVNPFLVYVILPTPAVNESCTPGQAVRGSMKIPPFVEGRVCGNEVDRPGVHSPEEVEVVAVEKCPVREVAFRHSRVYYM